MDVHLVDFFVSPCVFGALRVSSILLRTPGVSRFHSWVLNFPFFVEVVLLVHMEMFSLRFFFSYFFQDFKCIAISAIIQASE